MQVSGIVKDVSKQTRGHNARGDWTMQWVEFVDGNRVKVWTRPDLSSTKNKFLTIEGVTEDTDRQGKPCFNLSPDEGHIKVEERQAGTSGPVSQSTSTKPVAVRTIDDYENILVRAIDTVSKEFTRAKGAAQLFEDEPLAQAVAQVVTSYMAAYVRGDFAVETTADGEKIPF